MLVSGMANLPGMPVSQTLLGIVILYILSRLQPFRESIHSYRYFSQFLSSNLHGSISLDQNQDKFVRTLEAGC
jgi:hypothetical protein